MKIGLATFLPNQLSSALFTNTALICAIPAVLSFKNALTLKLALGTYAPHLVSTFGFYLSIKYFLRQTGFLNDVGKLVTKMSFLGDNQLEIEALKLKGKETMVVNINEISVFLKSDRTNTPFYLIKDLNLNELFYIPLNEGNAVDRAFMQVLESKLGK